MNPKKIQRIWTVFDSFFFLGIINLHKSWTLFSKFTSLLLFLFYCNFHDLEIQNVPLRLSDHCALLEADKCSLGLLKKKDAFSLFFFDLQKDKYLETVVSIESKGNSSEYPDKFPRDSYPIWSSSFFDLSWMVTIKERKSLKCVLDSCKDIVCNILLDI